jgi:hypothetical protein
MQSLPKDLIRLLFTWLPPRQRVVFTQVCLYIRSCSTLRERLTWTVGPPEGKIRRELQAIAQQVSSTYEFELLNFCLDCEMFDCHDRTECPYRSTPYECIWCDKFVQLWPSWPWLVLDNPEPLYEHFNITCYNCKDSIPWSSMMHGKIIGCMQCMVFLCERCGFKKCFACHTKILMRDNVADEHDCPNVAGQWLKFISDNTSSEMHVSMCHKTTYTIVYDHTIMIQIWVPYDIDPGDIGRRLQHSLAMRIGHVDDDMVFIYFIGPDSPLPGVPLMDQVKKTLTLGEYLKFL